MFRYQPPKSSVWGHLLRMMPAHRAKALFGQFLAAAVAEHRFVSSSFAIRDASEQARSRYGSLVGDVSWDGTYKALTEEQSEKCLDEMISDEAANARATRDYLLLQSFTIGSWRIDGESIPTESMVNMNYGQLPCITTFFEFETVEHFHSVRKTLEDIGLCKLNEKHLKRIRTRKGAR